MSTSNIDHSFLRVIFVSIENFSEKVKKRANNNNYLLPQNYIFLSLRNLSKMAEDTASQERSWRLVSAQDSQGETHSLLVPNFANLQMKEIMVKLDKTGELVAQMDECLKDFDSIPGPVTMEQLDKITELSHKELNKMMDQSQKEVERIQKEVTAREQAAVRDYIIREGDKKMRAAIQDWEWNDVDMSRDHSPGDIMSGQSLSRHNSMFRSLRKRSKGGERSLAREFQLEYFSLLRTKFPGQEEAVQALEHEINRDQEEAMDKVGKLGEILNEFPFIKEFFQKRKMLETHFTNFLNCMLMMPDTEPVEFKWQMLSFLSVIVNPVGQEPDVLLERRLNKMQREVDGLPRIRIDLRKTMDGTAEICELIKLVILELRANKKIFADSFRIETKTDNLNLLDEMIINLRESLPLRTRNSLKKKEKVTIDERIVTEYDPSTFVCRDHNLD